MKGKKYLLYLLLTILTSCEVTTKSGNKIQSFESNEFVFSKIMVNDFIKHSGSYAYSTEIKLKNNTKNYYSSAFVTNEIRIILENGNVLTNLDIDPTPGLFDNIGGMVQGGIWEPNQEVPIKLESPILDYSYLKYPIKKIYLDYIIKIKDEINNTERFEVFKTADITSKWEKLKSKK